MQRIKKIDLPDSVTELQGGAFRESGLETITWSDNLQTIGYSCFQIQIFVRLCCQIN